MIENLKYLGFIFRIVSLLKTIYRRIKKHRVNLQIPSKNISIDTTENKIRFLLNIKNDTLNTIKIESLTYSYKTGFMNLKKETKQVGIAIRNIVYVTFNEPNYLSQNPFLESNKKGIKIDPNTEQKIESCYVDNIQNKSIMIKIKYLNIGLSKPFRKVESIYLPI